MEKPSAQSTPVTSAPQDASLERGLSRLSRRAGFALWWERIWPALVPVLSVAAVFVAASWLGAFSALPSVTRLALLATFGVAGLASLVPLARIAPPAQGERLRRIDRDSDARHGLASAWADQLGTGEGDGATRLLWEVHRRRLRSALSGARVAWPRPGMVARDRYALRTAPLLVLAAAYFAAGPDRLGKVAAALDPRAASAASIEARIDGWIDPPNYTRMPPLVIDFAKSEDGRLELRAPVGSTLVLRWPEGSGVAAQPSPALKPQQQMTAASGVNETHWQITGDGSISVTGGPREMRLSIASIANEPPSIRIVGEPKTNIRGTVTLSYEGSDEYGIASVETRFADPRWHGRPMTSGHPLVEPPIANLPPPPNRPGAPPARDTFDLSAHPWAGADVTLRLAAKDEAGLEGTSDPVSLTLPAHPFTKPLARALVEQRRKLALDADQRSHVLEALYALMIAPEKFMPEMGIYISLRAIAQSLSAATNDDQLREVVGNLWELALVIEGSGPTRALDALRAAENALKNALDNNASKEEIEQRMAELRQALDRYMRELAERSKQNPNSRQADRNMKMLTERDLQSMLDKLGEMAKNGERDRAQRMLDQLKDFLDNLQTAQGEEENAEDQQLSQEEQALDEMSELLRKELELRDDTQSADRQRQAGKQPGQRQGQQRQGQRNPQGQQGQDQQGQGGQDQAQQGQGGQDQAQQGQGSGQGSEGLGGLSERQQRLRQRLGELGRKLGKMGSDEATKNLGDAGREMQDAEGALGEGDAAGAMGSEGRAIDAMRKGMNSLNDQLAQQQQQQGGQQGLDGRGHGRSRMARSGVDPLGRGVDRDEDEYGAEDYDNGSAYGKRNGLEGNVAERAREILQELRRRLGDTSRTQDELDYIERLLKAP
ncbi:MAG: TIGR02302 family protein [Hyphomicrobiales bacterium]|nr:TIGR02302 family protein [Hyphomicrobiales bacterium]